MEEEIKEIIENALIEDIGTGDITTELTIPEGVEVKATIIAKEDCVVCGLDIAGTVFSILDDRVEYAKKLNDGESAKEGDVLVEICGDARAILTGERVALNFLQRMCGIATKTKSCTKKVIGEKTRILDTRKTTPGLRVIEKYAVKCGGGHNHRRGLFDEILIKDNHIKLAGLKNSVTSAKASGKKVEVEARTLDEVNEAVECGADVIMLDNMSHEDMKKAVEIIKGKAIIEVSGGIQKKDIEWISSLGVDFISMGSLTHSVESVDIAMYIEKS